MNHLIDVELKVGTFQQASRIILENDGGAASLSEDSEEERLKVLFDVLAEVIKRKVQNYSMDKAGTLCITSRDIIEEGQGSIELVDPLTAAQKQLLKSLIKIIFHHADHLHESEYTNIGQNNLILSVFVKKITVEVFPDNLPTTPDPWYSGTNLLTAVHTILEADSNLTVPKIQATKTKSYTVKFYSCLEEFDTMSARDLLGTFDSIDLGKEEEDNNFEDEAQTFCEEMPATTKYTPFVIPLSQESLNFAKVTPLPSKHFEDLWENLHFEDDIKQKMYGYATVSLELKNFSEDVGNSNGNLDQILVNNKLLIVHGPPGTGKTTLCRGLCHKLSIRNTKVSVLDIIKPVYKGIVVEISCSHIFSRWFGESAKNIGTLFDDLEALLKLNERTQTFVCMIIDEVETIAGSRKDILSKNESSDSVRVVNTLLTRLDSLKKYNNFLILATSNLLESLDPAFVDRSDGVFSIGNPSRESVFKILFSSIQKLISLKVVTTEDSDDVIDNHKYNSIINLITNHCLKLELSGRTLRKLPLLCLSENFRKLPVPLDNFMMGLAQLVKQFHK
ncbi:Pch2p KNAG_0A01880 [Huiozyma naganishii CBS 8797]|uniref:AAA+ ATPase domain-containing protein n=1 Tax=Huiozyma naganishii (strain ATCC MYA-139 / BCRC 22969 / CBS 8797 / KCTC 17520 / NBRC 10181 / NCYC 3082 / Yp74L-3) TaxID=1071383 RepID=J7RT45_HUIN7|nr:hypothetical protein KNAG_0A01880 [Kazachstania naganishii CBS 8797]CCK67877.1 hypothetical protein KNAG_0A01880 [Kazachstania naganishii CBS 8797]